MHKCLEEIGRKGCEVAEGLNKHGGKILNVEQQQQWMDIIITIIA